ncbi:MAG: hypothetical protein Fur0032_02010 [Terrimicrobiaceae bacterium]
MPKGLQTLIFWRILLGGFLVLILGMGGAAQSAPGDGLTADELVAAADQAYNQRRFAEAAALYQRFFTDYAEAREPQVQETIRRRSHTLAMCYVQEKKFPEASEAIRAALAKEPPLDEHQRQELVFWLGVSLIQEKEYEQARKAFLDFLAMFPTAGLSNPNYLRQFPMARRITEARLLASTAWVLDEKFTEAAAELAASKAAMDPVSRGRATVLELYALLQAGDLEKARALVVEEFPNSGDLIQLVAFQTLTLQLGSELLDQEKLREAIGCLQRVWPSERLLRHQQDRLADLEGRLAAVQATARPDPYETLQLRQMIDKVRREIENFQKIENFDSALRLRLARAYLEMERYREAALIMEGMLVEMPPDPIVEAASVNLVQTWSRIERWDKAASAAAVFEEMFPDSEQLPMVIYLRGVAEQRQANYGDSVDTFERLAKEHPKSDFAARARFMAGFTRLLAEENADAIKAFDSFLKKHNTHELADSAEYWRAMGLSLNKQYPEARAALADYLENHKEPVHREQAVFRQAYCAQQLKDYETAIKELRAYLRKFRDGEHAAEARILLADALMATGDIEDGIKELAKIPPESTRFYEEGVFKTAKALRLLEDPERLLEHMKKFVADFPKSPRVAEAIYEIGRVHREGGDTDMARKTYWDAIEAYGGDASIRSVDDLFPALLKLYPEPKDREELAARLDDLAEGSNKTLAMRALWAQSLALRRSDPEGANRLLLEAAALADVRSTNPLLLADFAQAMQDAGKKAEAERLWADLVKWNPRAAQKDRALAALGFMQLEQGHEKAAQKHFDRFAREIEMSPLLGRVLLARAALLAERGKRDEARVSLNAVLENRLSTGPEKAEALCRIGELHLRDGEPGLAIPYFQRIYVMHSRWRDWVARAYLLSGEAFEKLDDSDSARRTYQELSEIEELASYKETQKALERLQALGGPLPKKPAPIEGDPAG